MSGASIAAEVAAALSEVANDVGDGNFVVTLKQTSGAPANPWETGGTVTETEIAAVVQMYARGQIDGTIIKQGDRRIMLAATGPRPSTADTLEVAGTDYRILNVDEVAPSGVAIYYELQARV